MMTVFRVERDNHEGPFVAHLSSNEESDEFYHALPSAFPWVRVQVRESDEFMQMLFGVPPTFMSAEPDETHPHHERDIPLKVRWDLEQAASDRGTRLRTGVESIEMLHHWFNPTPQAAAFFEKYGYQLSIYNCDERFVAKGKYQLVFLCEEATLVERKPFE